MNIGILGSGDVAKALAAGFLSRGDRVTLGSRDADKLREWCSGAGSNASAGTFAQAAQAGEWIVVATLGTAILDAVEEAGIQSFEGKIVLDVTNPLRFDRDDVYLAYTSPSNGERLQEKLPDARVVKAFNTVGNPLFVRPEFKGPRGIMFIAGDDASAKQAVSDLCEEWNWDVRDCGGIEASSYLEAMCIVWVRCSRRTNAWNQAFTFTHT